MLGRVPQQSNDGKKFQLRHSFSTYSAKQVTNRGALSPVRTIQELRMLAVFPLLFISKSIM